VSHFATKEDLDYLQRITWQSPAMGSIPDRERHREILTRCVRTVARALERRETDDTAEIEPEPYRGR
jgi:hypothetical protein